MQGWHYKTSDIWSVGCIAYTLMNGHPPFTSWQPAKIFKNILNNVVTFTNDKVSVPYKHFITRILQKNPTSRATIQSSLLHPWLRKRVEFRHLEVCSKVLQQFVHQHEFKRRVAKVAYFGGGKQISPYVKNMFARLDADRDGKISQSELELLLQRVGLSPRGSAEVSNQVMRALHKKPTDTISIDEFSEIWVTNIMFHDDVLLDSIFNMIDENNTGYIEKTDLQPLCRMFQSAELEFLFEGVHTYGEGRIHFQEFKKILRNDLKVMAFLHNKKKSGKDDLTSIISKLRNEMQLNPGDLQYKMSVSVME